MQPCFEKLHAFAQAHNARTEILEAIESAPDWDALCEHPEAGEWVLWITEQLGGSV
jgi:hypothetical protein